MYSIHDMKQSNNDIVLCDIVYVRNNPLPFFLLYHQFPPSIYSLASIQVYMVSTFKPTYSFFC